MNVRGIPCRPTYTCMFYVTALLYMYSVTKACRFIKRGDSETDARAVTFRLHIDFHLSVPVFNPFSSKTTRIFGTLWTCADPGGGQGGLGPPPPPHKILLPQIVRRGPRGPWPPPLQNPGSAYDGYVLIGLRGRGIRFIIRYLRRYHWLRNYI